MDAYAPSGQVAPDGTSAPTPSPTIEIVQASSQTPAVSPPAPATAGTFLRQLPRTVPWWGWGLGGIVVGWAIGSRR